ncbi:MAG: 30S ribosomal protein S20 [Candidatus Yanofskybacteria bacterium]|nr:30S ribosomal protein S20 [Candidatus Yanofskybacteria bacterium]
MPITKSAQKALRQSKRRKLQNSRRKTKFRSLVKEFRQTVAAKDFDKAKQILPAVYKALDKAAKTNAIKKNRASRLKSRLTKSLSQNKKTPS